MVLRLKSTTIVPLFFISITANTKPNKIYSLTEIIICKKRALYGGISMIDGNKLIITFEIIKLTNKNMLNQMDRNDCFLTKYSICIYNL